MDVEEEMYEEHLDDDDDYSIQAQLQIATTASSTSHSTSSFSAAHTSPVAKNLSTQRARNIRKLVVMFANHLEDFQRTILLSRRRWQNRQRRRQAMLRTCYVQQMIELETNFLELLPLPRTPTDADSGSQLSSEESVEKSSTSAFRFYEDLVMGFSEEQWLFTFHMSRSTFTWLCKQLKKSLQLVGVGVPLEKRVALALYSLATGDDYRSVAMLFNVSRRSVSNFVCRFAEALLEKLGYCLLTMPKNKAELDEIRNGFQQASNMPPLVVGVLGLSELHVQNQTHNGGGAGVILQTLVDDKLLFRKVRVQTNRVTMLLDANNEIAKLEQHLVNGQWVPCFAVTSTSYHPLRTWLLHGYEDPVEPHEYDFNETVDSLLQFKEKALKRLFGRWKILQGKVNLDSRTMDSIAVACCALHNLLEEAEESYSDEWDADVDMQQISLSDFKNNLSALPDCNEALEMRDFLARTISSTEM